MTYPPATYLTHRLGKSYVVILGFYMPISNDDFDDLIQAGIPIDCDCFSCLNGNLEAIKMDLCINA